MSSAAKLQRLTEIRAEVARIDRERAEADRYDWSRHARAEQLQPEGEWRTWLLLAGRGFGKALSLGVEIPTPTGWTTMADLRVGDAVFDERGRPCVVTFATEVMYGHECFDVVFDDGTVIVADGDHQWVTKSRALRKAERRRTDGGRSGTRRQSTRRYAPGVVTTRDVAATLMDCGERNHSIDVCAPLDLPTAPLPIDPYVLGVWLGDGDSRDAVITSADPEIIANVVAAGFSVSPGRADRRSLAVRYSIFGRAGAARYPSGRVTRPDTFRRALTDLGVRGDKHIPAAYLRASLPQRTALLQGLMDTDGSVQKGGHCEFLVTNERLARGAEELIRSLGMKPVFASERAAIDGRDCGPRYRISFTPHTPVFRLSRKLERQHSGKTQASRTHRRYITDVRPRASVPVRCIQVDSESHLFLASRSFVPTHNTRALTETVREWATSGRYKRIALVARTAADVRDVLVEGASGILAVCSDAERPRWNPSIRRLTFPSGAIATTYSAEEPDQLRGPQHDAAIADEIAAWEKPETFDQLMLGLRIGTDPRVVIATTPRPTKLVRGLLAAPGTVFSRGSTRDNIANLAPGVVTDLERRYAGSRLGRQELFGELIDDAESALWSWDSIESGRVREAPKCSRIIVSLDPNAASEETSERCDDAGIVVIGKGYDGRAYVLADASGTMPVREWARKAIALHRKFNAACIVAERNIGGPMIRATVRAVLLEEAMAAGLSQPEHIVVNLVMARGEKAQRSGAARELYPNMVSHVGCHPRLEDTMTTHDYSTSKKSPGDLDALSMGLADLVLAPSVARVATDSYLDF